MCTYFSYSAATQLRVLRKYRSADATGYGLVRLCKLYKVPFDSGVLAVDQLG